MNSLPAFELRDARGTARTFPTNRAGALLCFVKEDCPTFAEHLQDRIPGIEIKRFRKPTFTKPAPDDLRRRIAEESDFVIEALAD